MLRILHEQRKLALASHQLQTQIRRGKSFKRTLGYVPKSETHTVWWHARASVWGSQERKKNRLRAMFGISDPTKQLRLSINLEINSPVQGINRRAAGIFLEGRPGEFYLGHRANKICRIKKEVFRRHLKNGEYWHWTDVEDGHRESEVIVLRRGLRDPLLLTALGALAREVKCIKKLVR
jgi:5-methylcytosine-specific restriction protein B